MDNIRTLQGDVLARDLRVAIIASRFNDAIVDHLVRGAVDALLRHGASEKQIEIIRVPGAYDLPFVARRVAAAKRCDAIVALGAVIRGATPHFDYVCGVAAHGISRVGLDTGVPVTFGVITALTEEQAWERAGGVVGNRGEEAALAALEMAGWLRSLRGRKGGR